MIFVGIFLMFALFGGLGFAAYKIINKNPTDKQAENEENNIEENSAQAYMPWSNIENGTMDLGANCYRAFMKCSSINYDLKTDQEKSFIEANYQTFLNSLSFPITVFIQTREIDNGPFMEALQEDYEKTIERFPELFEYANQNFQDMLTLNQELGVTRQKDKYIIVHYDDENKNNLSNEHEKVSSAYAELASRCSVITEGLGNMGINANRLDTQGIISLMYTTFNRDGADIGPELFNGDFFGEIVARDEEARANEPIPTDAEYEKFLADMRNELHYKFGDVTKYPEKTVENAEELGAKIEDLKSQLYQSEDIEKFEYASAIPAEIKQNDYQVNNIEETTNYEEIKGKYSDTKVEESTQEKPAFTDEFIFDDSDDESEEF